MKNYEKQAMSQASLLGAIYYYFTHGHFQFNTVDEIALAKAITDSIKEELPELNNLVGETNVKH